MAMAVFSMVSEFLKQRVLRWSPECYSHTECNASFCCLLSTLKCWHEQCRCADMSATFLTHYYDCTSENYTFLPFLVKQWTKHEVTQQKPMNMLLLLITLTHFEFMN